MMCCMMQCDEIEPIGAVFLNSSFGFGALIHQWRQWIGKRKEGKKERRSKKEKRSEVK